MNISCLYIIFCCLGTWLPLTDRSFFCEGDLVLLSLRLRLFLPSFPLEASQPAVASCGNLRYYSTNCRLTLLLS